MHEDNSAQKRYRIAFILVVFRVGVEEVSFAYARAERVDRYEARIVKCKSVAVVELIEIVVDDVLFVIDRAALAVLYSVGFRDCGCRKCE